MATLGRFEATCPRETCGARFSTWGPVTYTAGLRESDYREVCGFEDWTPYIIHTCPRCGYTEGSSAFSSFELLERLAPGRSPFPPPAAVWHGVGDRRFRWPLVDLVESPYAETALRWLLCAKAREDAGRDLGDRAASFLYASHHARMAGDEALEVLCQRKARALYLARLEEEIDADERIGTTYLVAELCRRLGDFAEAIAHFDLVLAGRASMHAARSMHAYASRGDASPRMMDGGPVPMFSRDERLQSWATLQSIDLHLRRILES